MEKNILRRIRALVLARRVFVSTHARKELREDGLSPFDLENVLVTGFVAERQRDARTRDWKHLIEGASLDGAFVAAVVKLTEDDILYVITVYRIQP